MPRGASRHRRSTSAARTSRRVRSVAPPARTRIDLAPPKRTSGDERTRTADPLLAKQVLYQLSYVPSIPRRGAEGPWFLAYSAL